MILPTFDDVLDAAGRLDGLAVKTPLISNRALDAATGARVFVKAECLQRPARSSSGARTIASAG